MSAILAFAVMALALTAALVCDNKAADASDPVRGWSYHVMAQALVAAAIVTGVILLLTHAT